MLIGPLLSPYLFYFCYNTVFTTSTFKFKGKLGVSWVRISAFMCQRKHWYLQRFVFPEMDNFLCGSVWDIPYDLAPGMVICGWAENHRRKPKQVSHTLTTDRKPTQLSFSRDRFHERSQCCFFFFLVGFFFLHFYAIVSIF